MGLRYRSNTIRSIVWSVQRFVRKGRSLVHFEMRAQALALLDALEDEKIPDALEYLKVLTNEPARPSAAGIEALLEESA